MNRTKIILLSIGLFLPIMIFTRPSLTDFSDYMHVKGFDNSIKEFCYSHYLVCSVGKVKFNYVEGKTNERNVVCFGILGNFITLVDRQR